MEERKKFRLADVVLSVICVVFVAEAAAPVASIGNSQYFWWVFMMIAFLLPYGMISSELGTTYTGDGGLYDWINKAFPRSKWGARASWYYWINFPLWMASLAVVCPELLGVLTGGWQSCSSSSPSSGSSRGSHFTPCATASSSSTSAPPSK